jgi:hypothetical protein
MRAALNRLAMVVAALAAAGHAHAAVKLEMSAAPKVSFSGIVSNDDPSAPGAMLYPAPNVVGLLAAIATHAVIANGERERARQAARDKADLVLTPYRAILDSFSPQDLQRAAEVRLAAKDLAGEVKCEPQFAMTQDQRAIVLENAISVQRPGQAKPEVQVIRLVGAPVSAADPAQHWQASEGRPLRDTSAELLARSVELALAQLDATPRQARTVRYMEGEKEKVERAEVLMDLCSQMVLRTLRGNLMVVPKKDPGACSAS